jgi:hypothetical protein
VAATLLALTAAVWVQGALILSRGSQASGSGGATGGASGASAGAGEIDPEKGRERRLLELLPSGPEPGLSPEQVVQVQLTAMNANDADDRGLARVFQFASPHNREATGPLQRFVRIVRLPPYHVMLDHHDARIGPVEKPQADAAWVYVTVRDRFERVFAFRFALRLQPKGQADAGCWMTDAVQPIPLDEVPDPAPGLRV